MVQIGIKWSTVIKIVQYCAKSSKFFPNVPNSLELSKMSKSGCGKQCDIRIIFEYLDRIVLFIFGIRVIYKPNTILTQYLVFCETEYYLVFVLVFVEVEESHWLESCSQEYGGRKGSECSIWLRTSWYTHLNLDRISASSPGHWVQTDFWPIAEKQNGITSAIGGGPIMEDNRYPSVQNPSDMQPFSDPT